MKMATLNSSRLLLKSSFSSSQQWRIVKATINIPKRAANISLPSLRTERLANTHDMQKITEKQLSPITIKTSSINEISRLDPLVMVKLYAVMESVADRIEMHTNIGKQRTNWNHLLLSSINALTLAAATITGISAISGGAAAVALKFSSVSMYVLVTGMLSIMNIIQPSQLAEEQRNAGRLFKQLQNQIETLISIGNPTVADVEEIVEKILAIDRAYPLPLLGVMLEKFPASVEPAVWWPEQRRRKQSDKSAGYNGWDGKLEKEMREIICVLRIKDKEDYLNLGEKALKLNKFLAISGPILTGLAALGSVFVGTNFDGGWAVMLGVLGGALASVVNSLEHGGQVGMVFEMYRGNAGFFEMMEESIGGNLREEELERRENGEVFELKVGLQLGRSLSQLRDLAAMAAVKGEDIDEFASKLF